MDSHIVLVQEINQKILQSMEVARINCEVMYQTHTDMGNGDAAENYLELANHLLDAVHRMQNVINNKIASASFTEVSHRIEMVI